VTVDGVQIWQAGTGALLLWANCPELSAGSARQVAAALLNAADELDARAAASL
jgi:hypothetical protein